MTLNNRYVSSVDIISLSRRWFQTTYNLAVTILLTVGFLLNINLKTKVLFESDYKSTLLQVLLYVYYIEVIANKKTYNMLKIIPPCTYVITRG